MNEELIQKFGFSEMYEWSDLSKAKLGIFVTFDKNKPNKIVPYEGKNSGPIIGVTTVNSIIESDNPDRWKYAYMCNEVGDLYLQKEKLAVGQKVYDQLIEFNYIQTKPWEHYIPVNNQYYDKTKEYVKRTNRAEWVRVNLMGKVVVRDNGECIPGNYCQPYTGKLIANFGTVVPATPESSEQKYYVIERLSKETILILNR